MRGTWTERDHALWARPIEWVPLAAVLLMVAHSLGFTWNGFRLLHVVKPILELEPHDHPFLDGAFDGLAGTVALVFGITGLLLELGLLWLARRYRGCMRLLVLALFAWPLSSIGALAFKDSEPHSWLWSAASLLAGASLLGVVASRGLLWSVAPERAEKYGALLGLVCAAGALCLALPGRTWKQQSVTALVHWMPGAVENPEALVEGYRCTKDAAECHCQFAKGSLGTCGRAACCYGWERINLFGDGPDSSWGCFCLPADAQTGRCPKSESVKRGGSSGDSTFRQQSCP